MEKKRLSRILAKAKSADVRAMADWLGEKYPVTVLREPMKTLVMMPMTEPVCNTPFYIGELLACEAMVELEGTKGFGICMGDDFAKSIAMAIIDAAFTAQLMECQWLTERLSAMELMQNEAIARESAKHLGTKVAFQTMEGQ